MDQSKLEMSSPFVLPSKGRLYGDRIPTGEVLVGSMTTKEEKIVASAAKSSALSGQAVDRIIQSCVELNGVTPDELVLDDRFALFLMIYTVSYGGDYETRVQCTECGERFKLKQTMPDDLSVTYLPDDFVEPALITLPVSKAQVELRLLRGLDEKLIQKQTKQSARVSEVGDASFSYRMMLNIVSVNPANKKDGFSRDDKDFAFRAQSYVDGLFARDALVLRSASNACGINPTKEVECQRCEAMFDTPYIDDAFFRPRTAGR